jgi:hypothetical protein
MTFVSFLHLLRDQRRDSSIGINLCAYCICFSVFDRVMVDYN